MTNFSSFYRYTVLISSKRGKSCKQLYDGEDMQRQNMKKQRWKRLFLVFLILFLLLDAKVMVMDVFHTVYIIFMWMDVIYSTIFIFLYNVLLKLMCYKSKGFNFKRCLIRRKNGTIQNNSFLCNLVFCLLGFEFIIH